MLAIFSKSKVTVAVMNFIGQSIVIDPLGNVVSKAEGIEQILYGEIDLAQSAIIRRRKPYFRLRRPEFYK